VFTLVFLHLCIVINIDSNNISKEAMPISHVIIRQCNAISLDSDPILTSHIQAPLKSDMAIDRMHDMNKDTSRDMTKDVNQDRTKDVNQDLNQDRTKGANQDTIKNTDRIECPSHDLR
jgi:hypothetical protein